MPTVERLNELDGLKMRESRLEAVGDATDPIMLGGYFEVCIGGDFTGTVVLQRRITPSHDWGDVKSFTAPEQGYGLAVSTMEYRLTMTAQSAGFCNAALIQGTWR